MKNIIEAHSRKVYCESCRFEFEIRVPFQKIPGQALDSNDWIQQEIFACPACLNALKDTVCL